MKYSSQAITYTMKLSHNKTRAKLKQHRKKSSLLSNSTQPQSKQEED